MFRYIDIDILENIKKVFFFKFSSAGREERRAKRVSGALTIIDLASLEGYIFITFHKLNSFVVGKPSPALQPVLPRHVMMLALLAPRVA